MRERNGRKDAYTEGYMSQQHDTAAGEHELEDLSRIATRDLPAAPKRRQGAGVLFHDDLWRKHQSQAESAPYLGDDERLFWQRAEDRNRATAEMYKHLGLAAYEAIEAFVQYIPID